MKTIPSLRRHRYLRSIGILLIAAALIGGILSCEPGATYELTMAANPTDGGTATDETGTGPYSALEVVDIKAVPADCHQFVNWEAPVGIIGNSTAAETTFIMPAQDVTVTANFEPKLPDHYKLYHADWPGSAMPKTLPVDVKLEDQFGSFNETVGQVEFFGNPVKKVHGVTATEISDWDGHYTFYRLVHDEGWMPSSFQVTIQNQFQDDEDLTVWGPVLLGVPTQKEDQPMSDCLDHLLVYNIQYPVEYIPEPLPGDFTVDLYDQFHDELEVTVYEPMFFANPVTKTIVDTGEVTPATTDDHYVFYPLEEPSFEKSGLPISNQFGDQTLDVYDPALLAVPSEKIDWEQPLNHFKTYWAEWPSEPPQEWEPPLPVDVQLEDQFVTMNATVWAPYLFANPTAKGHGEEWTPIWDPNDHLTLYYIEPWAAPQVWEVLVDNQFGPDQVLTIAGPFYLAVPTGKFALEWPADLNHFLVYDVLDHGEYLPEEVFIEDQFFFEGAWTSVYEPELFAVPTQKIHPPGTAPTPIVDDVHLVFYGLAGIEPLNMYNLPVVNQFGDQYLDVYEDEGNYFGVPSVKTAVLGGPWPYD
jgi:hypothetical protein